MEFITCLPFYHLCVLVPFFFHSRGSCRELSLFGDSSTSPTLNLQIEIDELFYGLMMQQREELHRIHQHPRILQRITIGIVLALGKCPPVYDEYGTYYIVCPSQQPYGIGTLIVLILQMSKLRPRLGNLSEAIQQFIAKRRLETIWFQPSRTSSLELTIFLSFRDQRGHLFLFWPELHSASCPTHLNSLKG